MTAPHDEPDARTLLEAVREFLATDVEPETSGRLRYHLKVAAHVLGMVERELAVGDEQAARHAERLKALGFATDRELAERIRSGELDRRLAEFETPMREMVADKLAVARPGYGKPVSEGP